MRAPPELLTTAPDAATAGAASAVALECAVAGEAGEGGATLGLANLLGGLVAAPPSFLATQPSLLLQLPVLGRVRVRGVHVGRGGRLESRRRRAQGEVRLVQAREERVAPRRVHGGRRDGRAAT